MDKTREVSPDKVRVIGVFAHVDAGKTTTSEAILYHTGRVHRVGRVDDGDTQLDWMEQERRRGITVWSAATTCQWRGRRIDLIDTPGHIDFAAEVVRTIRVIDGAVIVLCGVGGVEPQTNTVWTHADRQELPRVIFVNKLDRPRADFDRVLGTIKSQLTPNAVALQLPIEREGRFNGVVDLITKEAFVWRNGAVAPVRESTASSLAGEVASARASLVDAICETDDVLLEQRLAEQEPDEAVLQAALRRACVGGKLVPVLCGSALKRIGVQALLDSVIAYLPSPTEGAPMRDAAADAATGNERSVVLKRGAVDSPLCAGVFKIVTDPHIGHMTWVRVFCGRLEAGQQALNPRIDVEERVTRIYRMHADKRQRIDRAVAGDVVALVGVKSVVTGDTLCDPAHRLELESSSFPEPVIAVALTPPSDAQIDKLHRAVRRLCQEDPTLIARFDAETGQQTLAGMGELHLEISVDRLRTEFGVLAHASPPQIAYRETVRRRDESAGTYRKQSGGHGHYAQVRLRIEPTEPGQGVLFEDATPAYRGPSGAERARHSFIPPHFVRPIELGVREALEKGILAGYPVSNVRVTLLGGKVHEVDSSQIDFHIAASMAVRQAARRAGLALIEPVMAVHVDMDEQRLGAVTADIARRRGRIGTIDARGDTRHMAGEAPLANMRGYATDLRSLTHGRAMFGLEFLRYDFVPPPIAEQVIAQRRADGRIPTR